MELVQLIDQVIAHYRILGKLGEGGMGVVYKARDTHLDRIVAIKVLPPQKAAAPDRKARFVHEAKAASALNHPNIVTIYEIGADSGRDFIAMEYVEGKTLDQLIPRKGMRLDEALKITVQIADALSRAHSAGIIHRDLKPANIMVDEHGLVKVLDFGLAKLREREANEFASTETLKPQTEQGTIVGTAGYMSPEQAECKNVDARTDIFAFGCVLYEIVTGRRAFPGGSVLSTMAAILHEEPPPIEGVAPEVVNLIRRCLRKDPERRAQLMKDLRIALEDLKEDSDSGKLVTKSTPRASAASHSWLWIGTALTFFAVGVASTWLAVSSRNYAPSSAPAPLTSYPGFEKEPAFAPDGNQVAFVWDGEKQDNEDIYVKLIGSGRPLRVTTDPAADFSPAWSPDGRWIAFLRSVPGGKAAVLLVPPLGGTERKLGEIAAPEWWMGGPFLSWSTDSTWLALPDRNSAVESFSLFLLSVETGEKRRLTRPPAVSFSDTSPVFSPDGRSIAFCRASGLSEVYLLPLTSTFRPAGEPKQLTFGSLWAGSPSWAERPPWYSLRARAEIVFSSTMGTAGLWRIPASGSRNPEPLPYAANEASYPAVSSRTHRLVYTNTTTVSSISRVSVATGAITPLLRSTRSDSAPRLSPDGKRVAFSSKRSGSQEIWVANGDGSDATQLTSMGSPMTGGQNWSPDGTRIIFDSNRDGQFELYVVNSGGGKPQRVTDHPSNDLAASYSVDGKWVYFASNRSGDFQIWKMPTSGGAPIQVTRHGGFISRDSRDGKWLYYLRDGGMETGLWRISVEGGEETRVLETVLNRAYDLTAEGVHFLAGPPAGRSATPPTSLFLYFLSFLTGQTKPIASVGKAASGLTVSPDGRQILYSQVVQYGSDLMLVENFR